VPFDSTSAIPAGDWYFAVKTIYGLAHHDGAVVKLVADGAVIDDETVTLGKITVDEFAAVVHAGLGYEGFVKTHNLEIGGRSGPAQGKPRNISEMFIRFLNTLGVDFGTDIYNTEQIHHRPAAAVANRPAPVFSGIKKLPLADGWQAESEKFVLISQRLPFPCIVQSIDIRYDTTDEG